MTRSSRFYFMLLLALTLTNGILAPQTSGLSFSSSSDLHRYLAWHPDREPLISAHRGGPMMGFPENALETFQHSLNYGPVLIECDVRLSKDGQPVLIHDSTLDRTSTGSGNVSNYSLARLKQFFLKDPYGNITAFRIPTLAETLDWAVNRAVLTLDVKKGVPFETIIRLIKAHNAGGHAVIITYNLLDAMRIHRLAPDLMISASVTGVTGVEKLFASGIPAANLLVFVGVSEPAPLVYQLLHQKGIRTILGTMHNLDNKAKARGFHVYSQLFTNGADILSTDNVPMVSAAIKQMAQERGKKE